MNLVEISAYAEGYYSGQTYEERILITEESYKKLKDKIDKITIYVSELDGKHSEVEADIDVEYLDENNLDKIDTDYDSTLCYELLEIFDSSSMSLEKELNDINDYLNTLDKYIVKEVRIKESQLDKLNEFLKELGE